MYLNGKTLVIKHNLKLYCLKIENKNFTQQILIFCIYTNYKIQISILKEHQTLYSFRHSGAINIYQKTGSIIKLQKAMGHSSIKVSLTYLRGLEIPELEEDDMPMI